MGLRIAINGFGRIGRSLARVVQDNDEIEIVAINDLQSADTLAYLLKYDSVMGRYPGFVEAEGDHVVVDGRKIAVFRQCDPARVDWATIGVDVVVECTGVFAKEGGVKRILEGGAPRVIVSAPSDEADYTVVLGVNEDGLDPASQRIVSNSSCTTNCLAPVVKTLHERFTVLEGLVTTVHSYTNDQNLLDGPHKDLRRGRAAATSMVPTTTGAALGVGEVLPELADRLDGVSVRVPTPDVSLADITLRLEHACDVDEANEVLRHAAETELKGVMGYSDEPLVSVDYVGCSLSGVVDGLQTRTVGGALLKVVAWYDNEWGYANRLVELAVRIGRAGRVRNVSDLGRLSA